MRVYPLARMFWEWDICDALDILDALVGFVFHQPLSEWFLPCGLVDDEPPAKSEVSIAHICPGFLFFTLRTECHNASEGPAPKEP